MAICTGVKWRLAELSTELFVMIIFTSCKEAFDVDDDGIKFYRLSESRFELLVRLT